MRRLFAILLAGLLVGLALPASAGGDHDGPKTISAKALDDHECDSSEWHFVINQVKDKSKAPAAVNVTFSGGDTVKVALDKFTGKVAHYTATSNLDESVVRATAEIYGSWSGQFNLSHGPCGDNQSEEPPAVEPPTIRACPTGQYFWEAVEDYDILLTEKGRNAHKLNGSGGRTVIETGLVIPAGTVTILQYVSWDGHADRAGQNQPDETWAVLFQVADGKKGGMTDPTQDIPDGVASAEVSGNLGSFEFGVPMNVKIVAIGSGSVVPVSLCIEHEPPVTTTTTIPTTTPTTVPPTTTPPTTEPPTTTPPTTVPPTTETTEPPTTETTVPETTSTTGKPPTSTPQGAGVGLLGLVLAAGGGLTAYASRKRS